MHLALTILTILVVAVAVGADAAHRHRVSQQGQQAWIGTVALTEALFWVALVAVIGVVTLVACLIAGVSVPRKVDYTAYLLVATAAPLLLMLLIRNGKGPAFAPEFPLGVNPHAKVRWYYYELRQDGPRLYSIHVSRSGFTHRLMRRKQSQVSLRAHPDIVIAQALSMLTPGDTLVLATPNRDLRKAVEGRMPEIKLQHPTVIAVPYTRELPLLVGVYGNHRHRWHERWKRSICRGYELHT